MGAMDVRVQRSLVIPAPATLPPSSEVPFTVFDLSYHVTVLFAFAAPNPTNAALLDALAATLPRFPLLTARIERRHGPADRPFFITGRGGAGALVVEASVASALEDHLPLMPSPELACLQPSPLDSRTRQHLFRLQINRFACGGLIITSSSHHKAADGYSMSTFFNASGPSSSHPEPAVGVIKRPEIINTMLHLHYSSESVAQIKAIAENKYTTFETITAHLWRKITIARQEGFFGNVVLTATSKSTAKELARGSLADAAALVRAAIRAIDGRYFQSFIDFGELHGDEELEPVDDGNEDYALSSESWLHLDLHKLDFGCGGRLLGVVPPRIPLDGVLVLIPNLHKGDGVDVFVALCDKHAKELRNIAYTLD
ncbi:hypothetical protein PR202_gb20748 [Eleusine coracana subsp. coracana]|uniref:Uncharacterized protein n=1 Tax=Eleusine coracana subsp. coracana TaxID=191504 RepID=A0AAV5FC92_ELECO|nr:hypothetical protein PR202_gb20748 [Eleusine coracana subsp. coracana]